MTAGGSHNQSSRVPAVVAETTCVLCETEYDRRQTRSTYGGNRATYQCPSCGHWETGPLPVRRGLPDDTLDELPGGG